MERYGPRSIRGRRWRKLLSELNMLLRSKRLINDCLIVLSPKTNKNSFQMNGNALVFIFQFIKFAQRDVCKTCNECRTGGVLSFIYFSLFVPTWQRTIAITLGWCYHEKVAHNSMLLIKFLSLATSIDSKHKLWGAWTETVVNSDWRVHTFM